ncbi:MAG: tetratricopeptide repeat protein [Candidatus Bipolaricaulota bacterium]
MNTQEQNTPEAQQALVQEALVRAEKLRKKKDYKQAIELLVEALQYGIDKGMIYYRLGNVYIDGADLARAEYAYKRALDIDPHYVNAMHNLAIVYKRQKKTSLYVKTYKKSQRMQLRHPRKQKLTPQQKTRLRRLSFKTMLYMFLGLGAIAIILILLFR